ncbi:uncharacterized protein LOC141687377 isoform X2 [Apium graveolens]|uniref:uncharacterized protein LOC141682926 isoform X2 n=1 Tax=Apium graveolens TaxID=4045 RepID=UPI003D78DEE4
MCVEVGLKKGDFDLWYCLPEVELSVGLMSIENEEHVGNLTDMLVYTKLLRVYATARTFRNWNCEWDDFSFTQLLVDEKEKRVSQMIDEAEDHIVPIEKEDEDVPAQGEDEEDNDSFQGDNSNLDSTDSEVEKTPKKKKRIPPPNPPYRTRKRGRFSMLRGLFKNTEDTPVILDDGDPVETEVKESCKVKRAKNQSVSRKKAHKRIEGSTNFVEDQQVPSEEDAPPQTVPDVEENMNSTPEDAPATQYEFEDSSSEDSWNSADERMAVSSCDEADIQYPEYNEITGMDDPQFALGMLFTSGAVFRAAIRKHAIVHQRPIRLRKNLSDKIKWVCAAGCEWKCYGIKQKRSATIQIKTLYNRHTCNPTWEQKCVNSTWIANKYEDEIRMNPTWPTNAFHLKVVNDLKCKISTSMIYRALKKARENIIGKHEAEYGQLFIYGNEVRRQMPTSTVKIMSEPTGLGEEARRFKRFYVCLGPLKEGFLDGCRPIIGLDGCHLRGPLGGILLTAVVTDPNDGMYPLAWAQVEAENNDSWGWFIGLLKDDLRISNAATYTFISDRQKGLVNALESHVPEAEHRFCVMHLYRNLHKEHKSIGVRRLMWCAARATTEYFFKMHMDELKKGNGNGS